MADTVTFFSEFLPAKLVAKPELANMKAIYQFNITDAGTWTLDLSGPPGSVSEGPAANPGCIITVAKADWERLLDNPSLGMQLFMTGKLKATSPPLALNLQKILA